jgi:hypothetical protein
MEVTMLTTYAGPDGVAHPGTVIDIPAEQAKELIGGKFARKVDPKKDEKARRGLQRYRLEDE